MKNNILIIGFGNIGQRHFQSFYNLNKKLNIFIIEKKFKKTVKIIKNNYSYNKKINIEVNNDLKKLKTKSFFLTIVATNANVRYLILKKLIRECKSRHIILEKILFKNYFEFNKCLTFTKDSSQKIWVNLPRREYKIMQYVKSRLDLKKKIKIKFSGFKWGMASNMIHFLDVFKWLTKASEINFNKKLNSRMYKSKRNGFHEIRGEILFKDKNNNTLKIIDNKKFPKNKLEIVNNKNTFLIEENVLHILKNKKRKTKTFSNNFQSKLTYKIYNNLLKKTFCKLPKLKNTQDIHNILYLILEKKFKKKLFT